MPDDDIPSEDLWTFQALGKVGHEMTGYPAISNYHEFRYHPKEVITGVFDDWMYHSMGVHAWTIEIWSPQRQAGITDYKYIDWFRDHPIEDDVKLLEWSDTKLGGKGYHDWKPFNHEQLGPVEIGGWDVAYAFRNPPPDHLEAEITPLAEWAIWHAGTTPQLTLLSSAAEDQGDTVRLRVQVQNTGWLPTSVTKQAENNRLCRGVIGEIKRTPPQDDSTVRPAWLIAGKQRHEGPQLYGWSHVSAGGFGGGADPTTDRYTFEWVVTKGATYEVTVRHDRAGTVRCQFTV
jgi:hypothetical protein